MTQDSNSSETGRDVLEGFDRISKLNVRKKFSNDHRSELEVLRVSLQVVVAAVGVNVISMSKVGLVFWVRPSQEMTIGGWL